MRGILRTLAFLFFVSLLLPAACTSSSGSEDAQATLPAVTPSPTKPPLPAKPKTTAKARFEGRYALTYILLSSKYGQSGKPEKTRWTVKATCHTGGACDAVIHSSNIWDKRAGYLAGHYRFSRTIPESYSCSSGGNVDYYMAGVFNYDVVLTDMALIHNDWVATSFRGKYEGIPTRGCGLTPAGVWESWSISGHIFR